MSEGTLLQVSGLHKESIVTNRVSMVDHTSAMRKKYGHKSQVNLQKTDSEDITEDQGLRVAEIEKDGTYAGSMAATPFAKDKTMS